MKPLPDTHPLRRLFRLATRAAIHSVGWRRNPHGEFHISEEILVEADACRITGIPDELLFHEYIRDYTLFMTRIFPASLRRLARASSRDRLLMKLGSLFLPFDDPVDYYVALMGLIAAYLPYEPYFRKARRIIS